MLGADTLSAIGTGLTLPFLVVFLHGVRGLSLPLAGGAVAMLAVASAAGNPLGGWLADRLGPRPTLIAGLLIAAAGAMAIAGVSSAPEAMGAAALSGLGVGLAWPAQDTWLARLVQVAQRSAVYATRHATLNLGLGVVPCWRPSLWIRIVPARSPPCTGWTRRALCWRFRCCWRRARHRARKPTLHRIHAAAAPERVTGSCGEMRPSLACGYWLPF